MKNVQKVLAGLIILGLVTGLAARTQDQDADITLNFSRRAGTQAAD